MVRDARNRRSAPPVEPSGDCRPCSWPGCVEAGTFRAPRSPRELRSYHWFCLQHVRAYNAAWNYYAGMDEAEVERDLRRDTVWRRPSWPLSGQGRPQERIRDRFGVFAQAARHGGTDGDGGDGGDGGNGANGHAALAAAAPQLEAMLVLELEPPLSEARVKARYKTLVKRHHPDTNGGTKESEEKFKEIQCAYRTIMESLAS